MMLYSIIYLFHHLQRAICKSSCHLGKATAPMTAVKGPLGPLFSGWDTRQVGQILRRYGGGFRSRLAPQGTTGQRWAPPRTTGRERSEDSAGTCPLAVFDQPRIFPFWALRNISPSLCHCHSDPLLPRASLSIALSRPHQTPAHSLFFVVSVCSPCAGHRLTETRLSFPPSFKSFQKVLEPAFVAYTSTH